jgi:hypothetical protein
LELPEGVALLTDASEVLIGIAGSRKSDESDEEAEAAS